jgi:predicted O-methyltransferase YrrM
VGIDTWQTALERAHTNVKEAGLDDRITLRNQGVAAVDDVDAYDCAWVPTFFIPEDVLANAVPNLLNSLRPDGWIVLGRFATRPDPLARATMELRTVRSGGCTIDAARSSELLETAGCRSVHELALPGPMPMGFVIGQKPL